MSQDARDAAAMVIASMIEAEEARLQCMKGHAAMVVDSGESGREVICTEAYITNLKKSLTELALYK